MPKTPFLLYPLLFPAMLLAQSAPAPQSQHWMISLSAVRHLRQVEPSGMVERRFFADPASFVMNGGKGAEGFPEGWRCIPTATFPSYAAIGKALESGPLPPEVKAIVYDNESWTFTPPEEQHDLARFEKLAGDAIHHAGLLFIGHAGGGPGPGAEP